MPASQEPAAPFIVTAELPRDIFSWANELRRAHFPAERNKLDAHVTLFHAFAPSVRDELRGVLAGLANEFAPPHASIGGLMALGGGTALAITSPQMLGIWRLIAGRFHGALTAQDQHEPRLHITIQNKVSRKEAEALQQELAPRIEPRDFRFKGLGLHLYRTTHWEALGRWSFRGKEGS